MSAIPWFSHAPKRAPYPSVEPSAEMIRESLRVQVEHAHTIILTPEQAKFLIKHLEQS